MNLAGWGEEDQRQADHHGRLGRPQHRLHHLFAAADQVGATGKATRRLAARFERGEFDLVAVGYGDANPDWVNRVRAGDIDGLKGLRPASLATLY